MLLKLGEIFILKINHLEDKLTFIKKLNMHEIFLNQFLEQEVGRGEGVLFLRGISYSWDFTVKTH